MRCDLKGSGEEVDELRRDLSRFWNIETLGKKIVLLINLKMKLFIIVTDTSRSCLSRPTMTNSLIIMVCVSHA